MARRSPPRRGRDQPRHRFRSRPTDPGKQAAGVIRRLQGSRIKSVGTARNYEERLVQIAARLDVALTALTPKRAVAYLKGRATEVGQKTLDMERQAIQAMMVNVTGQLPPGATLPVVKSVEPHRPRPRAYSPAQVRAVAARQDARNALATETALASGIRAHELLTLGRPAEQPPDDRRDRSHLTGTAAEGMKFAGRDGVVYTVVGKGGLVREVILPHRLANRLEERRLRAPRRVVDAGPVWGSSLVMDDPSPRFPRHYESAALPRVCLSIDFALPPEAACRFRQRPRTRLFGATHFPRRVASIQC